MPRWRPAATRPNSVGGILYFSRLGRGRVGVMLGDVASHGFSAALVMALVMSAEASTPPRDHSGRDPHRAARQPRHRAHLDRDVLQRVLRGARPAHRPASTPTPAILRVSRASLRRPGAARGHGSSAGPRHRRQHPAPPDPWSIDHDLLVLWTDGLVERGTRPRGVRRATAARDRVPQRTEAPETIVRAVLEEAEAFGSQRQTIARC